MDMCVQQLTVCACVRSCLPVSLLAAAVRWKGKEIVLQLFARNRLMADAFIGGCSCKLGELVRAVGLEEGGDAAGGPQSGPFGGPGSMRNASTPGASYASLPPAGNLAPSAGMVAFQRVSAAEVRQFGELLPVLPGGEEEAHSGEEGLEQGAGGAGAGDEAAAGSSSEATAATSSSGTHSTSSSSSLSSLLRRSTSTVSTLGGSNGMPTGSNVGASPSLPITWMILRHGGGPATLKQYPAPLWYLPAGRVAIYLDFVVLPPSSIPRMISSGRGARRNSAAASYPPGGVPPSPSSAAAASHALASVSLPSTILPNGWIGMSDNEKLAWAHAHRREQRAPIAPPMGGLVAFVARGLLGAGAGSATPFSAPVYGQPGVGGAAVPPSAAIAPSDWPFPWSVLRSMILALQASNVQDRIFYAWWFVLGFVILLTELLFTRSAWEEELEEPDPERGGLVPFDAVVAEQGPSWWYLLTGSHLVAVTLGCVVLKLGWNMLHEQQISQPWRRLDLVLTLLLGVGLGAAAQVCSPNGSVAARMLGMAALAATHAYARATLYQGDVVEGVLSVRRAGKPAMVPQPGPLGFPGGSPTVALVPSPLVCSHHEAVLRWTGRSLRESLVVGLAWITGRASRGQLDAGVGGRGIPGSVQLCLRSCFFLVGQVCARWLLLPLPRSLHWWLPSLTLWSASAFLCSLFGYLLLFMLGRDSAALKGRPWLLLFGLNSLACLASGLRFLPPLLGLLGTAVALTVWGHRWGLLALPLEWALTALFVPQTVWDAACPQPKRSAGDVRGMHVAEQAHAHAQALPPPQHLHHPLRIDMEYLPQVQHVHAGAQSAPVSQMAAAQQNRPRLSAEGRRPAATPAH